MKIIMILTSHDQLGDTGEKTGFWLEEFAAPYYVFKDAGAEITLASPLGGQPPLDPKSDAPDAQTPSTERFKNDADAQQALANTKQLSTLSSRDYDAVFYPGGHGPLWDLVEDGLSVAFIESMYVLGRPIAAVCHGPCVFRHALKPTGSPVVKGLNVTCFTNSEEAAVGLSGVVPFSVEDMLKKYGTGFSRAEDWQPHVVVDGNIITGQNPASSVGVAEALLKILA
jgi:putative intracellular protease/amidase